MKTITTNSHSDPTTWEKAARIISIIAVILGLAGAVHAQPTFATGDFRTKNSGEWTDPNIWEVYDNLTDTWNDTTNAPDYTAGMIMVSPGHIVEVTEAITVDQVVVQTGAELIMSAGSTGNLNLHNGTNHDLNVFGVYRQRSTTYGVNYLTGGTGSSNSAAMLLDSGGVYYHEVDGGHIPEVTWDDSSTLIINGMVSATALGNGSMGQTFGKVIWDNPLQTSTISLRGSGRLMIVTGEFKIASTGTGAIVLGDTGVVAPAITRLIMDDGLAYVNNSGVNPRELEIIKDFIMYGGKFIVNNSLDTNSVAVLTVLGNLELNDGAVLDITTNTEKGSVAVKGNVTVKSGATLQRSATGSGAGAANLIFLAGDRRYYVNEGNVAGAINWSVSSGADVDFGENVVYGSYFINNIDSRIRIGHPQGITVPGIFGGGGNIQTALREYSMYAYYEYNGTQSQVTGDGLPSRISAEIDTLNVGGLIINNIGGDVTLSESTRVSGMFSLRNGRLITSASSFGPGLLTLGTTAFFVDSGSTESHVYGPLAWRTNQARHFYFPMGDGGVFKPISIAPQSVAFHIFTAQAFDEPFLNTLTMGPGLNNVSTIEHWRIGQDSANANAIIRLYWNDDSQVKQPDSDLRVTRYNGTRWIDEGNDSINPSLMFVEAMVDGSDIAPRSLGMTPFTFGSLTGDNPLPVELISFTGRYMEGAVLLNWSTASEKDNDYFIVERSMDAENFAQVGERVMGHGTSTRRHDYSMTDNNNITGNEVLYYRLRQVDIDGTEHLSDVIAVHPGPHNETVEIAVHPNPFVKDLNVRVTGSANGQYDVRVIDITGKIVASETGFLNNGSANLNLPVQNLESGVYMVQVSSGANSVVTKIVKR